MDMRFSSRRRFVSMVAVAILAVLFSSQAEAGGRRCKARCAPSQCCYTPPPCPSQCCLGTPSSVDLIPYGPNCATLGIDQVVRNSTYAVQFNVFLVSTPDKAVLTFKDHADSSIIRGTLTDNTPT